MSMYRQLWLAVIISTLLALAGSLLASTLSARSYLSQQLTLKNADNATTLALALSQKKPDAVEIELAATALFDSGHYELVRVVDPEGKIMVERVAPHGEYDAPAWFVQRFPIIAKPGEAQISSGWHQVGTVQLVSHSRFAYRALWDGMLEMIAALSLAGLVGGYLGSLVLRRPGAGDLGAPFRDHRRTEGTGAEATGNGDERHRDPLEINVRGRGCATRIGSP
jgi:hypothetical protein